MIPLPNTPSPQPSPLRGCVINPPVIAWLPARAGTRVGQGAWHSLFITALYEIASFVSLPRNDIVTQPRWGEGEGYSHLDLHNNSYYCAL